jgi:probable phosphoglycerate mutase
MSRRLVLVRHGSTGDQAHQCYIGQTDLPLTDTGREQARRLHRALSGWAFARAFCSDLIRCSETATIVLDGRMIPLESRSDLREPSMGVWEGRRRDDIAREFPEEFARRQQDLAAHAPAGGESFAACHDRIVAVLADILAETEGDLLLVGHGSTNRLMMCHLLGMPPGQLFRLGQDHGCLNIIRYERSMVRLERLNARP